jgi:hypothetical protein
MQLVNNDGNCCVKDDTILDVVLNFGYFLEAGRKKGSNTDLMRII